MTDVLLANPPHFLEVHVTRSARAAPEPRDGGLHLLVEQWNLFTNGSQARSVYLIRKVKPEGTKLIQFRFQEVD